MTQTRFYKIILGIHVVVMTSMLFILTSLISVGFLLPASSYASLKIVDEVREGTFDYFGPLVKNYFKLMKEGFHVKDLLIAALLILNILGIVMAYLSDLSFVGIMCIINCAVVITVTNFIAGYRVYVSTPLTLYTGLIYAFQSVKNILIVFASSLCVVLLTSPLLLIVFSMGGFIYWYCMGILLKQNFEILEKKEEAVQ